MPIKATPVFTIITKQFACKLILKIIATPSNATTVRKVLLLLLVNFVKNSNCLSYTKHNNGRFSQKY